MTECGSRWGAGYPMRSALRVWLAIALCTVTSMAGAQSTMPRVQISVGECGSPIQLLARDVPLSEVFKSLSESLAFELQFEASTDPMVNLNLLLPAPELVAKLSPMDSVIVSQSRDPRCPRDYRIAKVWVLPKASGAGTGYGPPAATATATATAPATSTAPQPLPLPQMARKPQTPQVAPTPAVQAATPQEQSRRFEQMSRQAREAYEAYVRIYGTAPAGEPEEIDK